MNSDEKLLAASRLSLRNVKIHSDMSDETTCFSASVCLDGALIGTVSNRGTGGCNYYCWLTPADGERFRSYIASLSPLTFGDADVDGIPPETIMPEQDDVRIDIALGLYLESKKRTRHERVR